MCIEKKNYENRYGYLGIKKEKEYYLMERGLRSLNKSHNIDNKIEKMQKGENITKTIIFKSHRRN